MLRALQTNMTTGYHRTIGRSRNYDRGQFRSDGTESLQVLTFLYVFYLLNFLRKKTFLRFFNLIGWPMRSAEGIIQLKMNQFPVIYSFQYLFRTLVMLESSMNSFSANSLKCLRMCYFLDRHFQLVNPELNMLEISQNYQSNHIRCSLTTPGV